MCAYMLVHRENFWAAVVAIMTLYPGFTMIGMAIWPERTTGAIARDSSTEPN